MQDIAARSRGHGSTSGGARRGDWLDDDDKVVATGEYASGKHRTRSLVMIHQVTMPFYQFLRKALRARVDSGNTHLMPLCCPGHR